MLNAKAISEAILKTIQQNLTPVFNAIGKRFAEMEALIKAIPAGQDGKDIDPEVMKAAVATEVACAVASIPPAKDGRDVDPDAVHTAVADAVAKAISEIPKPKNGKDVDVADLQDMIATEVSKAVALVPVAVPKDGKDADPEAMRLAVAEEVAKAMSAIPVPRNGADGKDVDPQAVREMVAIEVEKGILTIPAPENGKSVTVADVAPFIQELVAKAVAEIPMPKDGVSVSVDVVQRMVGEAVGNAFASVRLPVDGQPGRDAAHIEILPAIDEEKAYPRSTYAKHAGGLWRSFEATNGMRGWECIVEGVKALEVTMFNERDYSVSIESSSGTVEIKKFTIPAILDRGVYRPENCYVKGDGVTYGGSFWIAQSETKGVPGAGEGWRLAVKKGRDGADAKTGGPK